MTETLAQWKLVEVPSRAAQGNDRVQSNWNAHGQVVWAAAPALTGEPIASRSEYQFPASRW